MEQKPKDGKQSKVANRQTGMSREIQGRVQGTGEGRYRESWGWSTKGVGWSRSLEQAWVGAKRVDTNIKGKGTGKTRKQISRKTRRDYDKTAEY